MYSILLSVYIKENPLHLRESLESIFSQTIMPSEVVIVKDGLLTEELEEVIDTFERQKNMRIVQLPKNRGLGNALNEGLKYCSCDIVARMDTDDIAKPDRFEKQLQQFIQHPELDVVGSWVDEFTDNAEDVVSTRKVPEHHEEIYAYAKKRCPVNHPAVMFRKSSVLKVGSYRHFPLFEDYYLWVRLLNNGFKFYNIQESLLYFRTSPQTFQRRGGVTYLRNEIRLQSTFYKMGFISLPCYIHNLIVRFCIRLIPNKLRHILYKKFARN